MSDRQRTAHALVERWRHTVQQRLTCGARLSEGSPDVVETYCKLCEMEMAYAAEAIVALLQALPAEGK